MITTLATSSQLGPGFIFSRNRCRAMWNYNKLLYENCVCHAANYTTLDFYKVWVVSGACNCYCLINYYYT